MLPRHGQTDPMSSVERPVRLSSCRCGKITQMSEQDVTKLTYINVRDFTPPLQSGVAQIPTRPARKRKYVCVYAPDGIGTSAASGRRVIDVVSVEGHCPEQLGTYVCRARERAEW